MKQNYFIITAQDINDLEGFVNNAIVNGYVPIGSVFYTKAGALAREMILKTTL